jgi:nitroreductase
LGEQSGWLVSEQLLQYAFVHRIKMDQQQTPSQSLLDAMNWRYSVKLFRRGASIDSDLWSSLESCLALSPSSYGLQPWKFIVVTDAALKRKLRLHSWNQAQVEDCSHYVVVCARETIDEPFVDQYIARMIEVRGGTIEQLAGLKKIIVSDLLRGPRAAKILEYSTWQCYLALGNLVTAAALLKVDTCPIEGFVPAEYDKILGLAGTGWRSVVCCAAGYRHADDKYQNLKKVRNTIESLFERH